MRWRRALLLGVVAIGIGSVGAATERAGGIRGRVVDPSGEPVAGALVTLVAPHGSCRLVPKESFRAATTGPAGEFALAAPAEPMDLLVTHPALGEAVAGAEDGVLVRFETPAWISGRVGARALLRVVRGLRTAASVEAEGEFRIGPLPSGVALRLVAESPRHRLFARGLALGPGEERNLDVTLDEGRALTGRVAPAAAGVVVRASQGDGRESEGVTAADGSFRLTGLADGPVTVVFLPPDGEMRVVQGEVGQEIEGRLE